MDEWNEDETGKKTSLCHSAIQNIFPIKKKCAANNSNSNSNRALMEKKKFNVEMLTGILFR